MRTFGVFLVVVFLFGGLVEARRSDGSWKHKENDVEHSGRLFGPKSPASKLRGKCFLF